MMNLKIINTKNNLKREYMTCSCNNKKDYSCFDHFSNTVPGREYTKCSLIWNQACPFKKKKKKKKKRRRQMQFSLKSSLSFIKNKIKKDKKEEDVLVSWTYSYSRIFESRKQGHLLYHFTACSLCQQQQRKHLFRSAGHKHFMNFSCGFVHKIFKVQQKRLGL